MLKFYVAETFSENYTARIFPELLRTAHQQQCYKRRGSTTAFLHTKSHATGQNLPFCLLLANKNGGVAQKMAAKMAGFSLPELSVGVLLPRGHCTRSTPAVAARFGL